jgi:hypothetical protein
MRRVSDALLVNRVFGDPLLHIRLQHQGRSLLFGLSSGEYTGIVLARPASRNRKLLVTN